MLKIRFFRTGKKHQPSFKVIVTDRRRPPRGGRFVEAVGFWNSLTKEKTLKKERIKYWISKGAKPSGSVYNLLIKEKVLEGKKIDVHKKSKKKPVESPSDPETQQADDGAGIQAGERKKEAEIVKSVKKEEVKEEIKKPEEIKQKKEKKTKPKEEKSVKKKEEKVKEPAKSPSDNQAGKEKKEETVKPAEAEKRETT